MPYQSTNRRIIKVGSRKSDLALKQSSIVIDLLKQNNCNLEIQLVTMDTLGDKVLDVELSKIGDKSLFTKELELALIAKEVDLVVHSLKDVPTAMSEEFVLGCICMREASDDVVVIRKGSPYKSLEDLPEGSVIGTSSVRRVAQLKQKFGSKLRFVSIRGNLNTRFLKLDDHIEAQALGKGDGEEYSAIIVAHAGLQRLGWEDRVSQVLCDEDSLYAVGQGALTCECRADDHETLKLLSLIHHEESALTSIAERSLMRVLDGGCSTPIAVRCETAEDDGAGSQLLRLRGKVLSVDGSVSVEAALDAALPLSLDEAKFKDSDEAPEAKRRRKCAAFLQKDDILFLGLRVWPICEVGRLRMAASRELGAAVAGQLLERGARELLAAIPRTAGEHKANGTSHTGLDKPPVPSLTPA